MSVFSIIVHTLHLVAIFCLIRAICKKNDLISLKNEGEIED